MNIPIKTIDFFLIRLLVFFVPFMFYLNVLIEINTSGSDIIIFVVLFWLLLDKENRDILSVVFNKYRLLILYLLVLIYACIVSMINYFTNLYVDLAYGLAAPLKLSFNFVYVFVILIFIEKYKDEILLLVLRWWKRVSILVACLIIGGVVLYQYGVETIFALGGRGQGTFKDPNMAALYLIVSLTMMVLYHHFSDKRIINFSIMILVVGIFMTASRGGIISLSLAILLVLFISLMSGRIKELYVIFILTVLFASIILWINSSTEVLSLSVERMGEISEQSGTSDRFFLWGAAYNMWTENLFIGAGIGQYVAYSPEMFGYTLTHIPHNTYLTFLSETGIIGFIALIWFPLYLFIRLVGRLIIGGGKMYFYLLIGLTALAIQAMTINIENFRFTWIFFTIIFVIVLNEPKLKEYYHGGEEH